MGATSNERFVAAKVLINFEEGPVAFDIPRSATLADVSEKFYEILKLHQGRAMSVDVRFGASKGKIRAPLRDLILSLISGPAQPVTGLSIGHASSTIDFT